MNKGQIGLVVLLIMAVLLTVGIGVASESVINQKTARQEVESSDTFNAADEAIEWALGQDLSTLYQTTTYESSGGVPVAVKSTTSVFERVIETGDSGEVAVNSNETIQVGWQKKDGADCGGENPIASLVVTLLNQSGVSRMAYGPSECGSRNDGFALVNVDQSGWYQVNLPIGAYQKVRIKAVYGPASVRVSGTSLPQQYTVTAEAKKASGESRTVMVEKGLSGLPGIFDYAVFAGQGSLAITTTTP